MFSVHADRIAKKQAPPGAMQHTAGRAGMHLTDNRMLSPAQLKQVNANEGSQPVTSPRSVVQMANGGADMGHRKTLQSDLYYEYHIVVSEEQGEALQKLGYSKYEVAAYLSKGATITQLVSSDREAMIKKYRADSNEKEETTRPANNKKRGLKEVFFDMVEASGQQISAEKKGQLFTIAENAHRLGGNAKAFTNSQKEYQHLLFNQLQLSKEMIMNFNRSAGYEYEFSTFYEKDKIGEKDRGEILRSHILLASSEDISSIFELSFRLETDSHNALEMVTPPFLFLVCAETQSVLKNAHDVYQGAVKALKDILNEPENTLIRSHLGVFADLGFGSGWAWKFNGPQQLCATSHLGKHASIYGQLNVSLAPEEIMNLMSNLIDIEERGKKIIGGVYQPSNPTTLFTQVFQQVWKLTGADNDLKGVAGLYARSASNILAIPSVLYRNVLQKRPEKGNYATDVKETLGIWVKGFSYLIISDYLSDKPKLNEVFLQAVDNSAAPVWGIIQGFLQANTHELEQYYLEKYTRFYANKIETLKQVKLQMLEEMGQDKMAAVTQAIIVRAQNWDNEKQQKIAAKTQKIGHLTAQFMADAYKEYEAMVHILLTRLKGGVTKPPVKTDRGQPETFGQGLGVRKETYIGQLPGKRNMRVAEIRNSDDLPELEHTINQ